MSIKLSHLLEGIKTLEVIGDIDKNIVDLRSDSRKAVKDGMFVAVRGVTTDGDDAQKGRDPDGYGDAQRL